MAKALESAAAERPTDLRYVRYVHAPGPPIAEFTSLIGHGSYELAFRDAGLYEWLLRHECIKCAARPLGRWHELPQRGLAFG